MALLGVPAVVAGMPYPVPAERAKRQIDRHAAEPAAP